MNVEVLLAANVVALGIVGVGVGACYHKVRRAHLMAYEIAENAKQARNEASSLFGQLQALTSLNTMLQMSGSLPPMRGWAASPDFLLLVAEEILNNGSLTVLECSSGSSTVVAARCLQMQDRGHVYSLEHDSVYAEKTRALLRRHGLANWATVIDAPLQKDESGVPWYSLSNLPTAVPEVDLLVIDGPPGVSGPLARYPALPRLRNRLSTACTVLLDDANRPGEQTVLSRWRAEFPEFEQELLPCEKGAAVLRSRSSTQSLKMRSE